MVKYETTLLFLLAESGEWIRIFHSSIRTPEGNAKARTARSSAV